jgi:heme a synthase
MPAAAQHPGAAAPPPNPWPHRWAVVTAAATLVLIVVGGLVTNTGSALAVPDWPTTFGYNMFLYPWSRMVGGVLYEHGHRLLGSAVGLLTIACAVALWRCEPRKSVRVLGWLALGGVVAQGVIGGLRVVLLDNPLAIVHGCVAQAFFALMVGVAACTSGWWWQAAPPADLRPAGLRRLRAMAVATAVIVYVQLVFGSIVTHTAKRLDAHVGFAVLVTLAVVGLTHVVLLRYHAIGLRRPAVLLLVLLALQLGLGVGVYLWRFTRFSAAMSPLLGLALEAAHRCTGTALWGVLVLLALRIARLAAVAAVGRDGGLAFEAARREAGRRVLA